MTELVDCGQASYIGVVAYENMSRSSPAVAYDDLITYNTVVPYVGVGEEGAIITDRRFRSFSSAGMNTDKFPDSIPVPNFRGGDFLRYLWYSQKRLRKFWKSLYIE